MLLAPMLLQVFLLLLALLLQVTGVNAFVLFHAVASVSAVGASLLLALFAGVLAS